MKLTFFGLFLALSLVACNKSQPEENKEQGQQKEQNQISQEATTSSQDNLYAVSKEPLPQDLEWKTNLDDPIFSDPNAKKGGTLHSYIMSFPLTLRKVGPDSNGGFAGVIRDLSWGATELHPNTRNPIPLLATHWAHGKDNKTFYLKINPKAKWSDGKALTVDDFIFTLEFMNSKAIVAPWYNQYYGTHFEKVIKYDNHTMAIVAKIEKSPYDQHLYYGFGPTPKHFYTLSEDFVKGYNWKIPPTLAPYQIDEVKKGKYITLKRVKNWWGENEKYLKNRFNIDEIKYTVIRDMNVAYEHFTKAQIDIYSLVLPENWHNKAQGEIYDKGYVEKYWFYNDAPQPEYGIWLNTDREILKDINVRRGLMHSFNVQKVLDTVLRGDYERQHNNATGSGEFENKELRARAFDIKKAGEYFDKAGWSTRGPDGIRMKDGKRLSLEVLYGAKHHSDRLVVFKEEAKKVGVELKLKLMDSATAFKAMLEKQHDIAHTGWSGGIIPKYREGYHKDNAGKPQTNNISNINDDKLSALIDAYRLEFDRKTKAKISRDIQQRIFDLAIMIPTYLVPYDRFAAWRWIRFPSFLGTGLSETVSDPLSPQSGGLFWIDEQMKEETEAAMKAGKSFSPVLIKDTRFKK